MAGSTIAKHKMAKAGLMMMQGTSQAKSLMSAGYAPSTAKAPSRNGINADQCINAVAEVYPTVLPSDLLETTRKLFRDKIVALGRDNSKVKLGEISRALEVVERYHGERTPDHREARNFGERLALLSSVLTRYQELGGDMKMLMSDRKTTDTGKSKASE